MDLYTKLKQKNLLNYKVFGFSLFVGFFSMIILPQVANATNFDANGGITVTTDIVVNNKNDNFIRVVKGQRINLKVSVTLNNLKTKDGGASPTTLVVGQDSVDFGVPTYSKVLITKFGVGLEPKTAGNTCTTQGILDLSSFSNKGYLYCTLPGGTNPLTTTAVVGQTYTQSFSADPNLLRLDTFNITNPSSFIVYPYIDLDVAFAGNRNISIAGASKEVFVQFYNSQPELDAAEAANIRPAGVPPYGSNTGSTATAPADGILALINTIIAGIFLLISEAITALFFGLVAPLIQALLSIHPYTDAFVNVIYPGWEIVRNVSNILFIVTLMAMALGTLFRVESYNYRSLLVKVIIAALLVNFSLVIAQAVLALADTIQSQFLPNNKDVIMGLARSLMVTNTKQVFDSGLSGVVGTGAFSTTVSLFFYLTVSIATFGVFAAIAAFLFIRIIMLWLLLLLSPIAYVAGILPTTEGAKGKWWGEFIKYAFFTPIMAFFLNLAAVINLNQPQVLKSIVTNGNLGSVETIVYTIGSNLLLLVFLFASLEVANQAGVHGAGIITSTAKKGWFAPFKLAGAGVSAAGSYAKDKADKYRLQTALKLGKKENNPLTRAAGAVISGKKWFGAAQEQRKKELGILDHQLQDRYQNRSRGKSGHEGELHTFDAQMKEMESHINANTGSQLADVMHHAAESNDLEINKAATISKAVMLAADKEQMEDLLRARGYGNTREEYLRFIKDLETQPGMNKERVAYLVSKLEPIWRKTNRTKFVNALESDGHSLVENEPPLNPLSGLRDGESEYNEIFKLPKDQQSNRINALPADLQKYKGYFEMRNTQKEALARKGFKPRLSDYDPTSFVESDAKGNQKFNDEAADMLTQGGPGLYAQAESLSAANRNVLERTQPKVMENAFYQSIRRDQLAKGIDDRGAALDQARNKVVEVHKKLLNMELSYDSTKPRGQEWSQKIKVPKTNANLEDELKSDSTTYNHLNAISEPKLKNAVVGHYESGYRNLSSFRVELPTSVQALAGTSGLNTEVSVVANDAVQKVGDQFANRFEPIKIAQPGETIKVNNNQLRDIKDAVKTAVQDEITNNPTQTIGQLRANIEAELQNQLSGLAISVNGQADTIGSNPDRLRTTIDAILAGIK